MKFHHTGIFVDTIEKGTETCKKIIDVKSKSGIIKIIR